MAKVTAPLFSFTARGKLADALVFFPWKGISVVRKYTVPANPNTTAQQTQRAYVTAAVAKVHTAQARAAQFLTEADQVAYSALAQAKGKIMTWFNMACKLWVDVKIAGKKPVIYSDGLVHDADVEAIDMSIFQNEETGSDLQDGKFYFGTSKTNLIHSYTAVVDPGVNIGVTAVDMSAFLTAGIKYYWQFRPDSGDDCVGADSGIYHFVAE